MIIAVDDVIPHAREAFSALGDVRFYAGRNLRPADIRDVDALVVRSITRVDADLLEGTSVKFVGTASIGMDNLDLGYLQGRGIHYSNAAGSNANAVAEYLVAALLVVAGRRGWDLTKKSIAVIGAGNVGSRVAEKAVALGLRVLLCDPPLLESTGDRRYKLLDQVLDADILSLHTPLTKEGPHATFHMIGQEVLARLSSRQFMVNTARGSVICERDLYPALSAGKLSGAVLDVWEGEPRIDYKLLAIAELGSPHIAGYSLDGKIRATEMMVEAVCRHFGLPCAWYTKSLYPQPCDIRPQRGTRGQEAVASVVLQAYDILQDDSNLRALASFPVDSAALEFDRLRNSYPLRPEFHHFVVEHGADHAGEAMTLLQLGFRVNKS